MNLLFTSTMMMASQTALPVAFTALIPPSIYDLDIDLANSCWFITTALLVVVMSLLFVIQFV